MDKKIEKTKIIISDYYGQCLGDKKAGNKKKEQINIRPYSELKIQKE